ncbi:DUF3304 domain-containing protein [Chromobacterium vaccinii]|nr:DUF3304 domain-containing protein [Chromobacterium vaccinii]QND90818.1 DUF3304 domain-containing protein [Chromobacterium vaccinii]
MAMSVVMTMRSKVGGLMMWCKYLLGALVCFLMVGCTGVANADSSDPYLRKGVRLDIVGINYVKHNISDFWVDGDWGGNLGEAYPDGHSNGGNASTCCFGLVDYKKPVKVKWIWTGTSTGPIDAGNGVFVRGKQLTPDIEKEAMVMLPSRMPRVIKTKSGIPEYAREDTLCVIFKDMDTVELQYGYVGCDQFKK